jgi:hypothetical protein
MKLKFPSKNELEESPFLLAVFIFLFLAAGIFLTFTANGTCDDGDSIMHYQFARFSWHHHELFFHHWAKPLYVLIASPFAQFGLTGIKFFNLGVSAITIYITWLIAQQLRIKRSALVGLFMIMSPGLIIHSLSGLTEPLFALVLVISIWLYLNERIILAAVVVSFLPFVRSEGLIICGVFGLLFLLEKRFFVIPLLALGHIVYSIAGYPVHHSFLWVFTKIPYAYLGSIYGKGTWRHFFVKLPFIIGIPIYALLVLGFIVPLVTVFCDRLIAFTDANKRLSVLIYGSFVTYFAAHVSFWALGIFNSFGLMRVIVGILPLIALIALQGFNLVDLIGYPKLRISVAALALLLVCIMPFSNNQYALHYNRDFMLNARQLVLKDAADYVKTNFKDYSSRRIYFDANYVSILFDIDYFDKHVCARTSEMKTYPPANAFLVWDESYSAFEANTPLDTLKNDNRLEFIKEFVEKDEWNYYKKVELFKTRDF